MKKQNKTMTLFDEACCTEMHSRFVARAEDLNRDLTDDEVVEEALYHLETLPYKGYDDEEWLELVERQMKALIRKGRRKQKNAKRKNG